MNSRRRIGVAFTKERDNRSNEYGVYDDDTCVFEGYRFKGEDGETQVGLPLAGHGAAYLQPHVQFLASDFEIVRYFK